MKPVTKLNLNMNPSVCEDGSLVFANNMKVDKDGCLTTDYGYKNIKALQDYNIVGHIVGLDNKIYLFTDKIKQVQTGSREEPLGYEEQNPLYGYYMNIDKLSSYLSQLTTNRHYYFIPIINGHTNVADEYKLSNLGFNTTEYDSCFGFYIDYNPQNNTAIEDYFNDFLNKIEEIFALETSVEASVRDVTIGNDLSTSTIFHNTFCLTNVQDVRVFGVIYDEESGPYTLPVTKYIVQDLYNRNDITVSIPIYKQVNTILEFDEITEQIKVIETGWKYNDGTITGCVTTNISGEKILTIAEHKDVNYIDVKETIKIESSGNSSQVPILPSTTLIDGTINTGKTAEIGGEINLDDKPEDDDVDYTESTVTVDDGEGGTTEETINVKDTTIEESTTTEKTVKKEVPVKKLSISSLIPIKHINLNYCSYNDDESIYTQAPNVPIANLNLLGTYAKTIPNGTYVFFIRYQIRKDVYTNWYLCSHPIFAGVSESTTTLQGGLKYINLHKDAAKSFIFGISFVAEEYKKLYDKFQLGFIISHDDSVNARSWKTFDIDTKGIYFDYENVQEIDIDDLQRANYEIYNVDNVTSFKNRLYISNYIESNFNPDDIKELASKITLGVSKTTNKTEQSSFKLNGYILKYNQTKGYYDSLANGGEISSIIKKSLFDINCGEYTKGNVTTKSEVVTFDAEWYNQNDPDFVTIHNIKNEIKGYKPFGDTWTPGLGDGRLGIVETYNKNNIWVFGPDYSNLHPWHNLGLTFIYGSFRATDPDVPPYLVDNVELFNKNSEGLFYNTANPSIKGWTCKDAEFTNAAYDRILSNVEEEVEKQSSLVKAYLYVSSGATKYKIGYISNFDEADYVIDGYNEGFDRLAVVNREANLTAEVYLTIREHIVGITQDGTPVLNINGSIIQANNITVVYKQYKYEVASPESIDKSSWCRRWKVDMTTTDYSYVCTFNFKDEVLSISEGDFSISKQASTLMPHSTYKAYAHFVDEHNIITNGAYIGRIETGGIDTVSDILSLKYSISGVIASIYKAFFISIENVGDKIIECFAYSRDGNKNYLHSIEIDSLLYNLNDNITIIDNNGNIVTKVAKYHSSGESNPALAFGNCGFITWEGNTDYTGNPLFVKIDSDSTDRKNNQLVKATNYLPLTNVSDVDIIDGFYGSYLCTVRKPSFGASSTCYVAGSDIYHITRNSGIRLDELDTIISTESSTTYMIRSNFNLNYLSLTEDINDQIFYVGTGNNKLRYVAKVINSAILSYIYELKSMYKDFSNIYFKEFTTYSKIDFDNTVRVSNVLSDENFNNSVFTFNPTEYYNIPTDRGIIVKLFSIGNDILVHTKGSLYKFDANNIIVGENADIQLKESDPFDAGITQIFDSQYGYGGIDNKEAGCITFDSYFFYDNVSKHIFGYSGNSQIITIDSTIFKFIEQYVPKFCRTIHDEKNDRVLFEFTSGRKEDKNKTYNTFCISYNYRTKSFISLHDLTLLNSFNSRYCCYSYKNNFVSLFGNDDDIDTDDVDGIENTWNIYGNATTISLISFGTEHHNVKESPFNIAIVVQPNDNRRESLDSVRYVGGVIKDAITKGTSTDLITVVQRKKSNPVSRFYAMTDLCVSSEIKTNVNDSVRPNPLNDYKGFKYDLGYWACNYFRNIINSENIYDYPNQNVGRALQSDNNSLVYGRFFVLLFEFLEDTPIKFEDIVVNSKNY